MAGIFGGAIKRPEPTPAPPPPIDNAADQAARDKAAEEQRRTRLAGGRASTILTSPLGAEGDASTARKTLLGS